MTRWLVAGFVLGLCTALAACGTDEKCGPSNCDGCCDSSGQCQGGAAISACGIDGNACGFCASTQSCLAGVCTGATGGNDAGNNPPDAGKPDSGTPAPDGGSPDSGQPQDSGTPGPSGPGLLWFRGDFLTNNTEQLAVLNGTSGQIAPLSLPGAPKFFEVSADRTKLAVGIPSGAGGGNDLWVIAVSTNAQGEPSLGSPVKVASGTATGSIEAAKFSPDGTQLAFHGDLDTDNLRDVFVVSSSGGTPTKVSPARPAGAATPTTLQPYSYVWSRNGQTLALAGDFEVDRAVQLYLASPSGGTPVTVLTSTAVGAPPASPSTGSVGVGTSDFAMEWTASKLVFKAKVGSDAGYRLYSVDPSGAGMAVLPNSPDGTHQVGILSISPDGNTLVFAADTQTLTAYELYKMPADGSAAPVLLSSGNVAANTEPSNFTRLRWSPDSQKLAFVADYGLDGKYEPYVISVSGGGQTRLAVVGTGAGAGDVALDAEDVAWSPDSQKLAYVADHSANNVGELWMVANVTSADQTPTKVQGAVTSGDVFDLQWTP